MSVSSPRKEFGGAVSASSVNSASTSTSHHHSHHAHDKSRKQTISSKHGKADTAGGFSKTKSLELERAVNDHIGATLSISHAFGSSALLVDGLQSFPIPASGNDKVIRNHCVAV
jgi:hypothetical protein